MDSLQSSLLSPSSVSNSRSLPSVPLVAPLPSILSELPHSSPDINPLSCDTYCHPQVSSNVFTSVVTTVSGALSTPPTLPFSLGDVKESLKNKLLLGEWFPCPRAESFFDQGLSRFVVKPSLVCKVGSLSLGLFLKDDEVPLLPSETPIGIYTGRVATGTGAYHLDLSGSVEGLIIDGSPCSEHPMTCFGRINEDIYNNKTNVKFGADGSIYVIRTIHPGEEILVDYGDGYSGEWDWIKQEALTALCAQIKTRFPFVTDLPDTLAGIQASRLSLATVIREIIHGTAWAENMHSIDLDHNMNDVSSSPLE